MQAFSNTYVCPYFPCTSPYCIALRSTALAPPNIQSLNRPPTSPPSQPGVSSFTISSILSRSEEPSTRTNREAEINSSKASSTEASQSILKMTPYSPHISIERLHPYHRPLTSGVGFTRATCNALHKGNSPRDELNLEIVSQLISYFYSISLLFENTLSNAHSQLVNSRLRFRLGNKQERLFLNLLPQNYLQLNVTFFQ